MADKDGFHVETEETNHPNQVIGNLLLVLDAEQLNFDDPRVKLVIIE